MKIKIHILFVICSIVTIDAMKSHNARELNELDQYQELSLDCSLFTNSIESLINEYKQMYKSLQISCQLHVKSSADKFKSVVDSMVEQKIDEYLASVETMKEKLIELKEYSIQGEFKSTENSMKQKCKSGRTNISETNRKLEDTDDEQSLSDSLLLIRNGQYSVPRERVLKFGDTYLIKLISAVYEKNLDNTPRVIEFLNSFSDENKIVLGYRLLFDQLKQNGHIYSLAGTTIAYRIFAELTNSKNENNVYLREDLPDSLKNFPWHQTVVISNVKLTQFARFWLNPPFYHDTLRLNPYTQASYRDQHSEIDIIPAANGTYFYMKSILLNAYLYADLDEYSFDNHRRRVFLWMRNSETKEMGRWQLEPILGSPFFKIKNIYWDEYLAIASGVNVKGQGYPQLLTLRSKKCEDDLCKWDITKYK